MSKKRNTSLVGTSSVTSWDEAAEIAALNTSARSSRRKSTLRSLKTVSSKDRLQIVDAVDGDINIVSPYEHRQMTRSYKKIFPNRVYTTWYRRYVDTLPEQDTIDFQPFDEVQKVDEDIAMQYFYGEDGYKMGSSTEKFITEKRKLALQRYRKVQEQEDREKASELLDEPYSSYKSMPRNVKAREIEFGATAGQKKIYSPIVTFLQKLHTGKKRKLRKIVLKPDSKWHILKKTNIMEKLIVMYKKLMQEQIHARFRKVIRLVVAVIRFIETIRFLSGDTKQILREIEHFKAMQNQESKKTMLLGRKKIFDVQKYSITKELIIPFETKMTLTKPWFTRHESEIDSLDNECVRRELGIGTKNTSEARRVHGCTIRDESVYFTYLKKHLPPKIRYRLNVGVIEVLQCYKSFVQYPPAFQRRLATLAWLIETQGDKYIIRERHIACDFYVLLKGKAKIMKLFGDPYIKARGDLKCIRYIKKSEGFGDECMSDPECEREYSVISCEPCSLLSINVYDYLEMLSTRKEHEFAPEHIIFLSNLKFMENFPKKKLLEEGNENLTVHYFRPETAITKDIKESTYVFVVLNGSCQLLSEIPPDLIISDQGKSGMSSAKRKYVPSFYQFNQKRGHAKMTLPPATWIKQQIDTQKRLLEPMCAMTSASIAEYKDKTRSILRTLPQAQRDSLQPQVQPREQSGKKSEVTLDDKDSYTKSMSSAMDSYYQQLKSASCITSLVNTSLENSPSSFRFSDPPSLDSRSRREMADSSRGSRSQMSRLSEASEMANTEIVEDDLLSLVGKKSSQNVGDDFLSMARKKSSFAAGQGGSSRLSSVAGMRATSTDSMKGRHLNISQAGKRLAVPCLYSRWRHVRKLSRGDYVGQEWLDYNDGPFEPPEEIMSLVSDGCEMILVRKSFLLKYLRKEW